MNDVHDLKRFTPEQREIISSSFNDLFNNVNTRNDTINKLIHILICEAIFLKEYDVLQKLANHNLI